MLNSKLFLIGTSLTLSLLLLACGGGGGGGNDSPPATTPPPAPNPPDTGFTPPATNNFVNWENHPLHAVALSPDGKTLAVVNTPDNRLELFNLESDTPVSSGSVSVGLDPVSVRFYNNNTAWVANHISDSISIVDTNQKRVTNTVQTCDEPYDFVFAGGAATGVEERAYISCSQINSIQVVETAALTTIAQFEIPVVEDPRAMEVSADRSRVYVAIFESGNATTLLGGSDRRALIPNVVGGNASDPNGPTGESGNSIDYLCDEGPYGGVNPPPNSGASFVPSINPSLPAPPPVGLIVRKNSSGQWMDDNSGDWTDFVVNNTNPADIANPCNSMRVTGWDMPDRDIAIIDVTDNSMTFATGLMNAVMAMSVKPNNGDITVVGTDAINEMRFEPNVNSIFLRVNLAVVSPASISNPDIVDLNPHLNYNTPTLPQAQRDQSLGDPRGIVWNLAGDKAYVTGMGSNNVIAINADGSRNGIPIEVGEGPIGLVLDENRDQLYVLNRFAASLSVIDTTIDQVTATLPLFDPTPNAIKVGRKHLYDTHETSGLGQTSCASCHIDSRTDRLAWDLGDPTGEMKAVVGTDVSVMKDTEGKPLPGAHNLNSGSDQAQFDNWHPMKGPMTTQTLQDIIGTEPLHHRGDQDGLEGFNAAFESLQGDDEQLTATEMQEFEDFLATITYPPNPFRNLDNTFATAVELPQHVSFGRYQAAGGLSRGDPLPIGNARRGFDLYTSINGPNSFDATRCVFCHTMPTGMGTLHRFDLSRGLPGVLQNIPPGQNGERHAQMVYSDTNIHRANKIQGWRQLYEKVGLTYTEAQSAAGFGNMSDGREPGVDFRAQARIFDFRSDQNVADFVAMVMSFSGSDMENPHPVGFANPPGPPSQDSPAAVGKQITIANANAVPLSTFAINTALTDVAGQLPDDALEAMAALANPSNSRLDLIAKGFANSRQQGWYYNRNDGRFYADQSGISNTLAELRILANVGSEITFTLVPRDSGVRVGIDRNTDGAFDGE